MPINKYRQQKEIEGKQMTREQMFKDIKLDITHLFTHIEDIKIVLDTPKGLLQFTPAEGNQVWRTPLVEIEGQNEQKVYIDTCVEEIMKQAGL